MLKKYVAIGRFEAGTRKPFEGPLLVYLDNHSVSVGHSRTIGSEMLHISPFSGSMFFGRTLSEGCEIVGSGFSLTLSGAMLGAYEDGGGKDGEFDIFKVTEVEIGGAFGSLGLSVSINAKTLPGSRVCYSAAEKEENLYKPIAVVAQFVIPPQNLPEFLALAVPLHHDVFAPFHWDVSKSGTPEKYS